MFKRQYVASERGHIHELCLQSLSFAARVQVRLEAGPSPTDTPTGFWVCGQTAPPPLKVWDKIRARSLLSAEAFQLPQKGHTFLMQMTCQSGFG